MENMHVVKGCQYLGLNKGTWSPDDQPEKINNWFSLETMKDMSKVNHSISEDLYNKISDSNYDITDFLDVTYFVIINKNKVGISKAMAVKKSTDKK